jgi:RHS repeat-associated protein
MYDVLFRWRTLPVTGKERDTESGLDNFGARYYGSTMGRFMSPDPSGLLAQHPENPQSWNLYVYALNNPLKNIDPTGLDCVYANDAGNGVESIDHSSNSGETSTKESRTTSRAGSHIPISSCAGCVCVALETL